MLRGGEVSGNVQVRGGEVLAEVITEVLAEVVAKVVAEVAAKVLAEVVGGGSYPDETCDWLTGTAQTALSLLLGMEGKDNWDGITLCLLILGAGSKKTTGTK